MFTEGEWVKATGIGYCCIRTGSMGDKTGKVIADMRIVDGYYNTFDASVMCAAKAMYEFLGAKLHHLPVEDQHAAIEMLKKARGEQ